RHGIAWLCQRRSRPAAARCGNVRDERFSSALKWLFMPARQPFTALCQTLARPRTMGRADLHVHTTCSDGAYTPGQVVELARRSGLCAVAITDHDTLAGITPARQAARDTIQVVAGVEITAEFRSHELHLLGYFVRLNDESLQQALAGLQARRV